MSRKWLFDEHEARGLLRVIAEAGESVCRDAAGGAKPGRPVEAAHPESDHRAAAPPAADVPEPVGGRAERKFFELVNTASQAPSAKPAPGPSPKSRPAPEPSQSRPTHDRSRVRPRTVRKLAPAPGVPAPTVWYPALLDERAVEQVRQVTSWLEAELASAQQKESEPPKAVVEIADRLTAAKEGTRWRLDSLTHGTPDSVKALLKEISSGFCNSECQVFEIQRQTKTTEWDTKLFKREVGLTPWTLIQQCRREVSSVLLRDTTWMVPKIAKLVGYESVGSFRKLYTNSTGFQPSQMRNRLRRVHPDQRSVGDDLLSWYFWVRHHRGELGEADFRAALAFLEARRGTRS